MRDGKVVKRSEGEEERERDKRHQDVGMPVLDGKNGSTVAERSCTGQHAQANTMDCPS